MFALTKHEKKHPNEKFPPNDENVTSVAPSAPPLENEQSKINKPLEKKGGRKTVKLRLKKKNQTLKKHY